MSLFQSICRCLCKYLFYRCVSFLFIVVQRQALELVIQFSVFVISLRRKKHLSACILYEITNVQISQIMFDNSGVVESNKLFQLRFTRQFLICRVCPLTHNFDLIMISHVAQTFKITQIEPFEQYSSMLAFFAFHNPTE